MIIMSTDHDILGCGPRQITDDVADLLCASRNLRLHFDREVRKRERVRLKRPVHLGLDFNEIPARLSEPWLDDRRFDLEKRNSGSSWRGQGSHMVQIIRTGMVASIIYQQHALCAMRFGGQQFFEDL